MRLALSIFALLLTSVLWAQPSAALDDPLANYEEARMLFEADAYGLAAERFADFLASPAISGTAQLDDERQQAELLRALSAQRAALPEANVLLEAFIDKYSPQPIAIDAIKQVADIAFAEKDYARAADFYERLPLNGLSKDKRDEVRFRLGYTAFASKDFPTATRYLGDIRANTGLYQEPAAYYYALTRYYSGDNEGAKRAFESLSSSQTYSKVLPGYLAQIYFADGEYDRVISYAMPLVDGLSARSASQIHLLIGRSYFELKRYKEALPHLEYYAQGSKKMSAADFYQLGYAQYQSGAFKEAAANLKQLAGEDTPLGQQALYYLGNAYLKQDLREEARPAFSAVSRMDYDEKLREEASWNVAKLNYELGYNQDALTALQSIPVNSRYYTEAQGLLSRVILASQDYAKALEVLNGIESPTPALRETKQRVQVLRGLQFMRERKFDNANTLFSRSLENASDPYYKALANYWMGDIAYAKGEVTEAARRLNTFLTTAKSLRTALPDDSNVGTASYLLGYVYLKQGEYGVSLGHFQEAIAELRRRQRLSGGNRQLDNMLGDAVIRGGDAHFKRNDYVAATKLYEEAIDKKYPGYVYAIFQSSIIEGLQGDETEKIIALERIADDYPKSDFADESLYELGVTYQSLNKLKLAHSTLERLVSSYPNSSLKNEALIQLGLVSYNQGNTETAINYYKQIFANQPKAEEVRVAQDALQEIYVEDLGRPDDYFNFLETVPGFKLDNSVRDSISYASAEAQYNTGKYDRAIEQYSRYILDFPKGGYALEALHRRADSYLILEQYPEALKDFESIIGRGQNKYYEESLKKAAQIAYDAEGDFDKSFRYYARLLELDSELSNDPEVQLMALRAAYRSGDKKAVEELASKVANAPGMSAQDKAVAAFYRGKMAYDRKDFDTALSSFNTVIRAQKNTEAAAEARYLISRIYYLQRELELAETITRASQEQSGGYPYWVAKSTLLLIDILLEKEDYLSARAFAEVLVEDYRGDAKLEEDAKLKLKEVELASAANSNVAPEDTTTIDMVDPETPENN